MPKGGSENQIESSDFTLMSLGELERLPSNLSINIVIVPSYSVRVIRRVSCSQVTRRPWRSRRLPLAWVGRFAIDADRAGNLVIPHEPIVRDVAPDQGTPVTEIHWPFAPAHPGRKPLDAGIE